MSPDRDVAGRARVSIFIVKLGGASGLCLRIEIINKKAQRAIKAVVRFELVAFCPHIHDV